MSAGFSKYTSAALLNSLFGKTSDLGALASAPTVYVALSTTDFGDDGSGGTEPSGGSYARKSTSASDWNAATDADPSVVDNANAITFAAATADWASGSDLGYFALFDASTSGNCLASGSLGTAKAVLSGDTIEFAAGDLSITLT